VQLIGGRSKIVVSSDGKGIICQAGGLLLMETLRLSGLDRGLSRALSRWRRPRAVHDPGKIITDLAVALALGGDRLADVAVLRDSPEVFGPVASDPTISRLKYSIGFNLTDDICAAILALPDEAWQVAYDAEGQVREGAWVAGLTRMLDLSGWPKGMRLIVRKERPHPGAQLRFTDIDGHRFTCLSPAPAPAGAAANSPIWDYDTGN
jgi:Transposase DDE domain group 1